MKKQGEKQERRRMGEKFVGNKKKNEKKERGEERNSEKKFRYLF